MANYIYIATSLDGFIAGKDGDLEWLNKIPNPDGSDYGFADFMNSIDAVVMGRNTYETVLTFGDWSYSKPVFVLSNTLTGVPENLEGKVKIIRAGPSAVSKHLELEGYTNLYIDGGKVIQSFLQEDLIDVMIITRVSILLGNGIPLFGENLTSLNFTHENTEVLNENLVKSRYRRKKKAPEDTQRVSPGEEER
jgi:dihydrofolate reductase